MRLLARLHARGMVHSDPHLDNFLTVAHRLHAVDGDGVRKLGAARSQRSSIRNLGLLLAQLPPVADGRIESLIHSYLEERGWTATSRLLVQCRRVLAEQRSDRYRRYLRKCQRDCSEFEVERRAGRYQVSVRAGSGRIPAGFFAEPDSLVQSGRMLKNGNSATVVRCEVPDATRSDRLVVKRYNSKGFWHALRRSIEPFPRFRRAWCYGQLLHLLGVPTARPLALCERGPGVFRPRGWLLLEDLGDTHLGEEVAAAGISDARVDEVVGIFSALRAAGLRHGDTKVTNFLIHDGHVHLIDLDAMTLSARGVERDIERFLDNWEGQTRERFLKAFQAAGLL